VRPQGSLLFAQQGKASAKTRQTLTNYHDLQYVAYLSIGKQTLTGIVDTGSFEMVVFSKQCGSCGKAGKYIPNISSSYHMGTLTNRQTYGSGDAFSKEATDTVSIASGAQVNQTFWEVTHAQMPLLLNAEFQAIVGVGPPETPAADAWASVSSTVHMVQRHLANGALPPMATAKRVKTSADVAAEMSRSPPMLGTLRVSAFSVCLGSRPGSDGFLTWNDTSSLEQPSLFTHVPVIGRHTWTLHLTGVWLAEPLGVTGGQDAAHKGKLQFMEELRPLQTLIGCRGGCGAVVDSGTSMLMMPASAIEALSQAVQRTDGDCSNIHELPDLVFDFDGIKVSLPPDSYVAEVLGEVPAYLEGLARVRRLRKKRSRCELLVMESSSETNYGPLWILGMPFFRSYYTSFQLGRSSAERSIHVTPAGEDCIPGSEVPAFAATNAGGVRSRRCHLRRVDPSKMLISHNAWRASTSSFMML